MSILALHFTAAALHNAEIKKAQDSPDMKSKLESFELWHMTPEQTQPRIRSDYDKYRKLIKLTGTKLE